MTNANTRSLRRAAMADIAGAAATAIGGLLVHAVVQPATIVSAKRWSYPWSRSALASVSILWARLHALLFIGVLGFARVGLVLALKGTVVQKQPT